MRMIVPLRHILFYVTIAVLISGCLAPDDSREPRSVSFEVLAASAGRVELEEPLAYHLSSIESIDVAPDGRMLLANRAQHRVHLYAADGALLAASGRIGSGTGEFDTPSAAIFGADEQIFVADAGNLRIQRLTAELDFDTLFHVPRVAGVTSLATFDGDLVAHVHTRVREAPKFYRMSADGEPRGRFHPEHPLYDEVPYWRQRDDRLVIGRDAIFAAGDKVYPIYRYDRQGVRVDSIGTPPPSWIPAPRPQRGEFADMSPDRIGQWMRSHTWIDRLAIYEDTLLLVSHGRYDPDEVAYLEATYTLDVYRIDGTKLYEDINLPGRVLHADDFLYLLTAEPPDPWTIERFALAPAAL